MCNPLGFPWGDLGKVSPLFYPLRRNQPTRGRQQAFDHQHLYRRGYQGLGYTGVQTRFYALLWQRRTRRRQRTVLLHFLNTPGL